MIKAISKLRKDDPKLFRTVEDRIYLIPDHINWYCRYSFGEFIKLSDFLNKNEMGFTSEQYQFFMSKFNECETNILRQMLKSSGDEVLKKIEQRVKIYTQKTQRTIDLIISDIQNEIEIDALIEEKKSKRTHEKPSIESDYEKLKAIFE